MMCRSDRPNIVAFRGERGSYNCIAAARWVALIVAFRGERGSYNLMILGFAQRRGEP